MHTHCIHPVACRYGWTDAQPGVALQTSATTLTWPDTFAFDGAGGLLVTTNRLPAFFDGALDLSGASGANFRVVRCAAEGH